MGLYAREDEGSTYVDNESSMNSRKRLIWRNLS